MYFDRSTNSLYTSDGKYIKTFGCPLKLTPNELEETTLPGTRFCASCSSEVRSIASLNGDEVQALIGENTNQCHYLTGEVLNSQREMQSSGKAGTESGYFANRSFGRAESHVKLSPKGDGSNKFARDQLPTILTLRGFEAISAASNSGARLLIMPVVLNPKIVQKAEVWRHKDSGKLWINNDYRRQGSDLGEGWECVVPWFFYRNNSPKGPIAAYVIPDGLEPGDSVLILDLIEDIPTNVNEAQGDAERLQSTIAVWNGQLFNIDVLPESGIVG